MSYAHTYKKILAESSEMGLSGYISQGQARAQAKGALLAKRRKAARQAPTPSAKMKGRSWTPLRTIASKSKKPGFLDTLFGGIGKVGAFTAKTAVKVGLPMPLDNDIRVLEARRAELRSLRFRMVDFLSKAVPRLLAKRLDALAEKVRYSASSAKAQADSAIKALDSAIEAGHSVQGQIKAGKAPFKVGGVFALKRGQAEAQFLAARERLNNAVSAYEASQKQEMGPTPVSIKDVGGAIRETAGEFGRKVSTGLVTAGEAAEKFGEGVKEAVPLARYLPIILMVGAGVYVISSLPRASKE